jgi:septal ring factor EnvC (AmiA/AmiB activator)
MAVPLSWKVGAAVAGLVLAAFAWHGGSLYLAARHADELTRDVARNAELEAQQAKAQAAQRSAELAAALQRRRETLASTYRQVSEEAAQYQVARARREERQRQEALREKASYRLGPDQQCADGIVIDRSGSSFSQALGKNGQPVRCTGDTAAEPLR